MIKERVQRAASLITSENCLDRRYRESNVKTIFRGL